MKVAVGSTSPPKVKAVENVFRHAFGKVEVKGVDVDSGVPMQPFHAGEITGGAITRAKAALNVTRADYGVGIEGGVTKFGGKWYNLGFVAIVDKKGRVGTGTSGWFECPPGILRELKRGRELGDVMDGLVGEKDTKKRGGAIGIFTRGMVSRKALYEHGVWMALSLFLAVEFFE
ncbi:MAG: inosine/xanthosine triphosphatase [Candidatus Hadarchaeota archaeon]